MQSVKIYLMLFFSLIIFSSAHTGSKKQHGLCLKEVKSLRNDRAQFVKFDAHIEFDTVHTTEVAEEKLDFEETVHECKKALRALRIIDNTLSKAKKHSRLLEEAQTEKQCTNGYSNQDMLEIVVGQNKMRDWLEKKRFEAITYEECSLSIRSLGKAKFEALTNNPRFQELTNNLATMRPNDNFKVISKELRRYFKRDIQEKANIITQQEMKALRLLLHEDLLAELIHRMHELKIDEKTIRKLKCALICSYSPLLFQNYKKFLEALYYHDLPTIISLLKKGVLINWFISEQGFSALSFAINNPKGISLPLIKILLFCPRLDLNMKTTKGNTAFFLAVEKNYYDIVKLLLEEVDYQEDECGIFQEFSVIDIDEKNRYGKTALLIAAEKNYVDMVKLLLNHGADKKIKEKNGFIPYYYAQKNQNQELIDLLDSES